MARSIKTEKETKTQKTIKIILWIILGLIILSIALYCVDVFVYKEINFDYAKIYMYFFLACILGVIVFFVARWGSKALIRSTGDELENPKQPVSNKRVLELLPELIARREGIPYRKTPDGHIITHPKDAITIRNERSYPDNTGQTSDRIFACELILKSGFRPGIHFLEFQQDLGEKHILENWNTKITEHTPLNTYKQETKKWPVTTAKGVQDRLQSLVMQGMDEGYSEKELEQLREFQRINTPTPIIMSQTPSNSSAFEVDNKDYEKSVEDDYEDSLNDIQKEIEEYRQRK